MTRDRINIYEALFYIKMKTFAGCVVHLVQCLIVVQALASFHKINAKNKNRVNIIYSCTYS